MSEESDRLAARAKAGDAKAFDALVHREKAGLYSFARRYVGDADAAYDIVQESFVSAWRALWRYDPSKPFGIWLRRIALNKCRDHARRGRTRRQALAAFALEPRAVSQEPSTESDGPGDALVQLDHAIGRLPALYKEALLLTTAGGLSHEAAARVLGVSAKAVEMRLSRARRRLGEILREAGEG